MRQLESTGIQRPDNPERFPDYYVLGVFPSDLGLESVGNPGVTQTLNALRQRALENDIERKFVVVCRKDLSLALGRLPECPCLFVERAFPPWFPSTRGARGNLPTTRLYVSISRCRHEHSS